MKLLLGDCLYKLKELEDNSVDSIVTDPPYGLSFMGKKWDYDVPSVDIWSECLRVLKPGGYLLAFAGTRTHHRMAANIEDAGFEIRDMIAWVYGSGFPKSLNIGKAVDKMQGNERKVVETYVKKSGDFNGENGIGRGNYDDIELQKTKGNSEWEGWGTALKPALEPITVARKPIKGTVADNVLKWGTGGLNIDESRIPFKDEADKKESTQKNQHADFGTKPLTGNVIYGDYSMVEPKNYNPPGRFPANIIFDEEAGKILDEQSGISKSTGGRSGNKEGIWDGRYNGEVRDENPGLGDIGGASRFFYCPKTSKKDRNEGLDGFEEKIGGGTVGTRDQSLLTGSGNIRNNKRKNHHPTVKPTDLMLYLIRLVTPKGGTTLDPFMGSGSTGKAAVRGGFNFIGIEMEEEYFQIATARIQYEKDNPYNEESGERIEINKNANKFF